MSKKLTQIEFENNSRESHSVVHEYLTTYTGNKCRMRIRCLAHDTVFEQLASTHMGGGTGCKECSNLKLKETRRTNQEAVCGEGFKYCKSCESCKLFVDFSKAKTGSFGLYSKCKSCCSKSNSSARECPNRKASLNKNSKKYYEDNKDRVIKRTSEYRKNNKEMYKKAGREWSKRNPQKVSKKCSQRRSAKLRAIPLWAEDEWDIFVVENMYELRVLRDFYLGVKHNVDHIVPLQSEIVCGLHCATNLQILTFKDNMFKGNRFWPDMW